MHFRRFASLLIGAWLAGCVFMDVMATQNFRSVDRLLAEGPPARDFVQAIGGHDEARLFLRHHAGEQNRFFFESWERIQIALGVGLFMVLLFGSDASRTALFCAMAMLLIVLAARFYLTPAITRLGREVDFAAREAFSGERNHFWMLHGIYSGMELAKLGLGLVLAGSLLLRGRQRSKRGSGESKTGDVPAHSHAHR